MRLSLILSLIHFLPIAYSQSLGTENFFPKNPFLSYQKDFDVNIDIDRKLPRNDPSSSTTAQPSSSTPATSSSTPILDSVPIRFTIDPGIAHKYELSGINISETNSVFITLNVCNEPFLAVPFDLPQNNTLLSLYAADTNLTDSPMTGVQTQLGFASTIITNLESPTLFIEIVSPSLPVGIQSSSWTYEITASSQSPPSGFSIRPNLYLVDTDFANALFITSNFTIDKNNNPTENISDYDIFVYAAPTSSSAGINRLSRSFCAINTEGALINQNNAQMSNTTRGYGNRLKGQIFVSGLNKSESYVAFLTRPSNRLVYQGVNFTTKADTNCQVIFDLDFCSGVAFAVPGNASAFTTETLRQFYDGMAESRYANFSKSLQNIPCNATPEIQYSLMRNCDDCANSYKQWLCGITIPRCTDWSNTASFLYPRPVGQSRNPEINQVIKPGKYKEILPCADLCYSIVQDCSPDFEFFCPKKNQLGQTYGQRGPDGEVSCSYPGAAYIPSLSSRLSISSYMLLLTLSIFWFL